jgi:hypothetical protein
MDSSGVLRSARDFLDKFVAAGWGIYAFSKGWSDRTSQSLLYNRLTVPTRRHIAGRSLLVPRASGVLLEA